MKKAINEPYKIEILEDCKEGPITVCHIDNKWWDICDGSRVESTPRNINREAVRLEFVAGAYWKADKNKKKMLQRIYGTAWENEKQLKEHNDLKDEAKLRDHRCIGRYLFILVPFAKFVCSRMLLEGSGNAQQYRLILISRITYVDSNSKKKKRPIMINRAVLGSLERYFGILIEHYDGDFPLWLSPFQVRILPVKDMQLDYCKEVCCKMKAKGITVEVLRQ